MRRVTRVAVALGAALAPTFAPCLPVPKASAAAVQIEPVPGGVILPITDPVPLFPWSVIWPTRLHRSLVAAVQEATGRLARQEGWMERPDEAWLPEPEATASAAAGGRS